MGLTPLDVTTKEKIITLHLAGLGRNEICRQFQKEGLSVSSGSISNVINKYKKSLQAVYSIIEQPLKSDAVGRVPIKI